MHFDRTFCSVIMLGRALKLSDPCQSSPAKRSNMEVKIDESNPHMFFVFEEYFLYMHGGQPRIM